MAELLIPLEPGFIFALWYEAWACSEQDSCIVFSSGFIATENAVRKVFDVKELIFVQLPTNSNDSLCQVW